MESKRSEHTTRRIQIDLVDMNNNMLMKIATDVCKLDQESRFTSPVRAVLIEFMQNVELTEGSHCWEWHIDIFVV